MQLWPYWPYLKCLWKGSEAKSWRCEATETWSTASAYTVVEQAGLGGRCIEEEVWWYYQWLHHSSKLVVFSSSKRRGAQGTACRCTWGASGRRELTLQIRPKRDSTGQGCSEMSRTSARHEMPVLPGRTPQGEIMPLWGPLKQVTQCKLLRWTYLGPYQKVSQEIHLFWLQVITSPSGWRPTPYTTKKQKLFARKLVDEMFCRFFPPEQLHSDQGRQFESGLIKEICNILRIKKTQTSPYHPQCDGLVEWFNRTLLDMLATTTKNHPFDWEDQLRKVCMAYNTSVHSSTGFTPFYLMFRRQANLPIDLMYGTGDSTELQAHDYAENLKRGLQRAYQLVRERLGAVHERHKAYYDRQVHGEPFQKNEFVWLHSPLVPRGQSKKLHHPWTGPYRVMEKLSDRSRLWGGHSW